MRCAIVGSGLAALAGYATLRHGGLRAGGDRGVRDARGPDRGLARRARRRSASGGCAPSRTGTSRAAAFPGLAVRESLRDGDAAAARRRRRRTATTRASTTSSRTPTGVGERAAGSGASSQRRVERDPRRRRRLRARRRRAVRARARRDRASRARGAIPGAVHAYEPHEYAARVAIVGAGMAAATEWLNALAAGAEVVSIRRREPLRRPLNVPRPFFSKRGLALVPPPARRRTRRDAARARAAVLSARARLGRAARQRGVARGASVVRRAQTQTGARFAGDLRDRVPARASDRTRCSRDLVDAHELETLRPLDRARPRLDRPDAHRRQAHARARRRRRAVGVPRRRHDRGREVRGPRLPPPRMSYTLTGRIQSRLVATRAGAARRARAAPLVGDRARRADARGRARCSTSSSTTGVSRTSRPGSRCRSACSSSGSSTRRCAELGIAAPLRLALLLYGVGWLSAQVFAHAVSSAPPARVRASRAASSAAPARSRRRGRGRRSSAASAAPTRFARRRFTCTAPCRGRS